MMRFHLRRGRAVLALAALAAPAAAQDIFTCSSSDMILTRANDLNANGTANDPGEYTKCGYSSTLLRNAQDLKYTALFGAPTLLWLDEDNSVNGFVRLTDANGNGVFEAGETSLLLGNLHLAIGQTSASNTFWGGFCENAAGDLVFANNNFSTTASVNNSNGLYRVTGITGTPVVSAMVKGSDAAVAAWENSSTSTATTIAGGAWERVVVHKASGTYYSYNSKDDVVYALRDLDNDGKFLSAGEVINFFNGAGHKAGLNVNPDFLSGGPLYFNYGLGLSGVAANSSGNRLTLLYMEIDETSGAVYLGTRTQAMDAGGPCPSCDVSGVIFKCVDLNGNGTCNDAGEVTVYCDQAADPQSFLYTNGFTYKPNSAATPGFSGLGIDPSNGTVYAFVNIGPPDYASNFVTDVVWKLVDNNLDGDTSDAGEQIPVNVQFPAGSFSKELEIVPDGIFAKPFASAMSFETPGAQSALPNPGCTAPVNLALKTSVRFYKGAPAIGNGDFQISVTGTKIGSQFAQLWVSPADWDPVLVKNFWDLLNGPPFLVGLPYPVDLSTRNLDEWLPIGFWNSPAPMYVDIFDLAASGTLTLDNVAGGIVGSTTGGVFTAGAPAAGDTINGKCTIGVTTNQPYVGRFDANIAIPNVPALAGATYRVQWWTEDPQSGAPPFPYVVSDVGILRIQ